MTIHVSLNFAISLKTVKPQDKVALTLRRLPNLYFERQVTKLLKDYEPIKDSVKIPTIDKLGRRDGSAVVLFQTPAAAQAAMSKMNWKEIADQWTDVSIQNYAFWQEQGK